MNEDKTGKIVMIIFMVPFILMGLTMLIVTASCTFSEKLCAEMIQELRK